MIMIVRVSSDAIYSFLSPVYLAQLDTNGWQPILIDFEDIWNLPNVLGALDGKHISIACPLDSGT